MKPSPRPQLTSAGRKEVLHDLNQHSEMEFLERVGRLEDRSATIPCFHNMIKHHFVLLGTPVQSIMFFISLVFVEFPSSIRGHSLPSQIYTYFIINISIYIYFIIYYIYVHISLYIIYMYIFHYIFYIFIFIYTSRSTTRLPSFCFCVAPSKLPIISPPQPSRVPLTWWPFFAAGFRCPFSVLYWFLDWDSWCKSWNLLENWTAGTWKLINWWFDWKMIFFLICVWFLGSMLHFERCMSFDLMDPLTFCKNMLNISTGKHRWPRLEKDAEKYESDTPKKKVKHWSTFLLALAQPYWVGFLKPKMEYCAVLGGLLFSSLSPRR